jgi:effector-binding domain-containing protein
MKRKIIALLLVVVLGVVVYYSVFKQYHFKKTVRIQLPIIAVTEQFNSPVNLKKWFAPFLNASTATETNKTVTLGNYRLEVENKSIYSCLLKFSEKSTHKNFYVSALPDTSQQGATIVEFTYTNSYIKELLFPGDLVKKAKQSFSSFADYLQDTKRVYGFEIKPVKVVDTLFLFKREVVPLAEKKNSVKLLFESLISYANSHDLGYNGNRIFYSQKEEDNIILFASIGITSEYNIPETESFEIKRMPFEKNLLEATYQGPYGQVDKGFDALKKYLSDRNMSSIAIPYLKFISNGYDFSDEEIVQLKIYSPIF